MQHDLALRRIVTLCVMTWSALSTSLAAQENQAPTQRDPRVQVLPFNGDFHGDEVSQRSGTGWLALVTDGERTVLKGVTLKVKRVFDPVIDATEHGPHTGKSIASEPPHTGTVLLLRGTGLRSGEVTSATISGDRSGLGEKHIALSGAMYTLRPGVLCGKEPTPCPWVLSDGQTEQILHRFTLQEAGASGLDTDSANVGLLWAGDLDRDGKLDLVVNVSNHYNAVAQIRVFLSSAAGPGKLLGLAGHFSAVGC